MTKTGMNYSACVTKAEGIVLKQHQWDKKL